MEISFIWVCASCEEAERPLIEENIKNEITGYIEQHQEPPSKLSIRLACAHPFALDGQAFAPDGKIIITLIYTLVGVRSATYSYVAAPHGAKS